LKFLLGLRRDVSGLRRRSFGVAVWTDPLVCRQVCEAAFADPHGLFLLEATRLLLEFPVEILVRKTESLNVCGMIEK
jgi:hypothetical protein